MAVERKKRMARSKSLPEYALPVSTYSELEQYAKAFADWASQSIDSLW